MKQFVAGLLNLHHAEIRAKKALIQCHERCIKSPDVEKPKNLPAVSKYAEFTATQILLVGYRVEYFTWLRNYSIAKGNSVTTTRKIRRIVSRYLSHVKSD